MLVEELLLEDGAEELLTLVEDNAEDDELDEAPVEETLVTEDVP